MTESQARFFQKLYPGTTMTEYVTDKYSVTFIDGHSAYAFDEGINYWSEKIGRYPL